MRNTRTTAAALVCAVASFGFSASAEVRASAPSGFQIVHEVTVEAEAASVFAALAQPEAWWSGAHSWSGDAANFSLDPVVGGCFCEALPEMGPGISMVEHLRVITVVAGVNGGGLMRLAGGLGPLQSEAVSGVMTWQVAAGEEAHSAVVSFEYRVGGYSPTGLEAWAGPVDGVIGEQLARLKAHVETAEAP